VNEADLIVEVQRRFELFQDCSKSDFTKSCTIKLCMDVDDGVLYFFRNWAWTYDPRKVPKEIPFVPYPYQEKFIVDFNNDIKNGVDNLVEKSRDMGATWMILGVFVYRFLFYGENFLVGSRKADLVDKAGEMATHFERMRFMINKLPDWMLDGLDYDIANSAYMRIYREGGASITGESMNQEFSRQGRYNCLTGDTMILSDIGWVSIKDAMEQSLDKFIGVDGKVRNVKCYKKNLPKSLIKITTKYGFTVTGTPAHRMVTDNGLKTLADLSAGDRIMSKKVKHFPKSDMISEHEAEVLGFLVSEGAVSSSSTVSFCQKDIEVMNRYIDTFHKAYGINLPIRRVERKFDNGNIKYWHVAEKSMIKIRNNMLAVGLERVKSGDKTIPFSVLRSGEKVQKAFLRALFEGDGSVSVFKSTNQLRVSYTTKSKALAYQLQAMLTSFGLLCGIKEERRKDRVGATYQLQLDCHQAKKFCDDIGFISKRKNDVGANFIPNTMKFLNHPSNPLKDEIGLTINKIEECTPEITYDVELDGDHLFIANGLVSHNSILLDEFAFVQGAENIWRATGESSPCRSCISTPNGSNNQFARLRKSGKIKVYTLHWRLHPEKDDVWYADKVANNSAKDVAQEIDINYTISSGEPFYTGFQRGIHLRKMNIDKNKPLVLTWDYGWNHPNCMINQISVEGIWIIVDNIFGENTTIDEFGIAVAEYLMENYPDYELSAGYGDPAGKQSSDKSRKTSEQILNEMGFVVSSVPSNTSQTNYAARKNIVEKKLRTLIGGIPALVVNDCPNNEIVAEGFEGGYRLPDANKYGGVTEVPVEDGWFEHPFNCMEYMAVNRFRMPKQAVDTVKIARRRAQRSTQVKNAGFSFRR